MDPEADQHDELGPPELGSEAEERLRSSIARAEGRRSRKGMQKAWLLISSSRSSITAEQQQNAKIAWTPGYCQVMGKQQSNYNSSSWYVVVQAQGVISRGSNPKQR